MLGKEVREAERMRAVVAYQVAACTARLSHCQRSLHFGITINYTLNLSVETNAEICHLILWHSNISRAAANSDSKLQC